MFAARALRQITSLATIGMGGLLPLTAYAHFQMIIPEDDIVAANESKTLKLDIRFWHPLEGHGMKMVAPTQFGVFADGKKENLLPALTPQQAEDHKGEKRDIFTASYTIKKPGDYAFYIEPAPYWEPAEEKFIVHYTKVIVNGFGMQIGWDKPVGLKAEIIPLTRPYGLWAGNAFQGIVKVNGKPRAFADVEVEYYNQDGRITPPADPLITQVVKTDANGVFTYVMPWAGWWGFAALTEDTKPMQRDGKDYPVEIGAVMWVKTYEPR